MPDPNPNRTEPKPDANIVNPNLTRNPNFTRTEPEPDPTMTDPRVTRPELRPDPYPTQMTRLPGLVLFINVIRTVLYGNGAVFLVLSLVLKVSEMEYLNFISKAISPGKRNGVFHLHSQDLAKDRSFGSIEQKWKQSALLI